MDINISRLVRIKQRLYNTYMKSKDNSDFERFKECEKLVNTSIRQAKRKFEKNLSMKENKKALNSYIRTKTNSRAGVGPLKKDGKLVSDNKTNTNILNSFFVVSSQTQIQQQHKLTLINKFLVIQFQR